MKRLVTDYVFDASEKTVEFLTYSPVLLEGVLLITNVTDNIIIYNFADPLLGGTVATSTLTLTYNTTTMSDTDNLQIWYDDGIGSTEVSGTVTANLSAVDNAVLDQIELNQDSQTAILSTMDADTGGILTAVQLLDNSVDGNYLNTNMNIAGTDIAGGNGTTSAQTQRVTISSDSTGQVKLAAGTAAIGKLTANSGVDIGDVDILSIATGSNIIGRVGHDVTGIGHGVKVVTTAGTDLALATSTACKKVDIQAQTDNTSVIAVGGSGVDATVATGTGVLLYPGDVYSLEIDNLADVYIDSLVNGEGVRFTYYT